MTTSNHFLHDSLQYTAIEKAIRYVANNQLFQPAELSAFLDLTEEQFHHLFLTWAGVTPIQFFHYLTMNYTVQQLDRNKMFERLANDRMLHCNTISTNAYQQGNTYNIVYGACSSPFGQCFIATTAHGICKLAFYDTTHEYNMLLNELRADWFYSSFAEDHTHISGIAEQIFNTAPQTTQPLILLLKGSEFQLLVWQALLSLPRRALLSYQHVAALINHQKATRAVASAIAKNNIAYLIPCHRIIRQTGEFGQYRWNPYRKQALIGWEACVL